MGKIYEYSDIVNYRVPKLENFLKVKQSAVNSLSELVAKGEIFGAKVFGSVAAGTANERSDFDLLVITEEDSVLPILREIFKNISEDMLVDIEPLIVDRKFAELGFHSIDKLFSDNIGLIPVNGNVVGKNPLDILRPTNLPIIENHEQYLIQKIRRFSEGLFTYSEADKNKVLQRALEAPINMGRETLQTLPYLGYPFSLNDISKKSVVNNFQAIFGRTSLIEGFNSLYWQDKEYTNFLKDTLDGKTSQSEYDDYVNNYLIPGCIPQAISWTKEMGIMYMRLLEGDHRLKEGSSISRRGKESLE